MKFRLTEVTSKLAGCNTFNVYYKRDQPAYSSVVNEWSLLGWFYTEQEARNFINEQTIAPRERFIEEFEVKS